MMLLIHCALGNKCLSEQGSHAPPSPVYLIQAIIHKNSSTDILMWSPFRALRDFSQLTMVVASTKFVVKQMAHGILPQ